MAKEKGIKLSEGAIRSLQVKLRQIPTPSTTGKRKGSPSVAPFWGQLGDEDASNPGRYKWTLRDFDNAAWSAHSPAIAAGADYTARELNGGRGPLSGQRVQLWYQGVDADDNLVYIFQLRQGVFPVVLAQDGGADGNAATAVSWTYTVSPYGGGDPLKKNPSGDDATGMSPLMQRLKCKTNKALRGLAWYNPDGDLEVLWADETPAFRLRDC